MSCCLLFCWGIAVTAHSYQCFHTFSNLLFSFLWAGEAGNDNRHNDAMIYCVLCVLHSVRDY